MKGYCLTIDGIDGAIAPIDNATLCYDEINEILDKNDEEILPEKLEEFKNLKSRLKRAKVKIFKIKLIKEIPLERVLMEENND